MFQCLYYVSSINKRNLIFFKLDHNLLDYVKIDLDMEISLKYVKM